MSTNDKLSQGLPASTLIKRALLITTLSIIVAWCGLEWVILPREYAALVSDGRWVDGLIRELKVVAWAFSGDGTSRGGRVLEAIEARIEYVDRSGKTRRFSELWTNSVAARHHSDESLKVRVLESNRFAKAASIENPALIQAEQQTGSMERSP